MTAYEAGQMTKNELLKQKAAIQGAIHMSCEKLKEINHQLHKMNEQKKKEKITKTAEGIRKAGLSSLGKITGITTRATKTIINDFKEGYKSGMSS